VEASRFAGIEELEPLANCRIVLIGEASHGTAEFYRERAAITRALIERHGFRAVAAEADWPDASRVNAYARGTGEDRSAEQALGDFRRFPGWMWRNTEVRDFVEWLRSRNAGVGAAEQAGFYGLDLYSLHSSIEAVLSYLDQVDPEAAARARERYSCFEQFGGDPQLYGYATTAYEEESCEPAVVEQLLELQRRAADLASRDGRLPADAQFFAERNAALVRDAERYYRSMFRGRDESWNLRDTHMAETLAALLDHLGPDSRVVVWAHNSHLGDARATEMGERGELNLGQLARERWGGEVASIGFTTFDGTVTAASAWGAVAERKRVRPALQGSWEELLHRRGRAEIALGPVLLERDAELAGVRIERAIGVIYRPQTERLSHYFDALLADQFDAVLQIDRTHALEPLEPSSEWVAGELPETYPSGV
jgi:erythromycin esterase-like protein